MQRPGPAALLGGTGGSLRDLQHYRSPAPHDWTSIRGLKLLRRRFPLPADIAAAVERAVEQAELKPSPPAVPALQPRPLTRSSQRVGCIAYKAGMTQEWDEHGARVPLTVLWVDDCQVREAASLMA
jgi:hypothetical protein